MFREITSYMSIPEVIEMQESKVSPHERTTYPEHVPPKTWAEFQNLYPYVKQSFQHEDNRRTDFKDLQNTKERNALDPNFKKIGTKSAYSETLLDEWLRCRDDIFYFAERYCLFENADANGMTRVKLRPYQREMLRMIVDKRHSIHTVARQLGKTSTVTIYMAHQLVFGNCKHLACIAQDGLQTQEILRRTRVIIEHLPDFLQPAVTELQKKKIAFENGSDLIALSSKPSTARGKSLAFLYLDEAAHIENFDEIYTAVKPIFSVTESAKMCFTSTPNGVSGKWYDLCKNAEAGKGEFSYFFANWRAYEHRLFHKDTKLFDDGEKFKQTEIDDSSEKQFRQEHECAWIGSASTLLSPETLDTLVHSKYTPELIGDHLVKYFEDYNPSAKYIMNIDISEGKGGDYLAAVVTRIGDKNNRVVATFRTNDFHIREIPPVLIAIGEKFKAWIVVEVSNSRSTSANVIDRIRASKYPRIYSDDKDRLGTEMTPTNKALSCALLKQVIESGELQIPCEDLIHELMTFVTDGKSFHADKGSTDDLVACLLGLMLCKEVPSFIDMVEQGEEYEERHCIHVVRTGGYDNAGTDYETYDGYDNGYAPDIYGVANQYNNAFNSMLYGRSLF
ncbi:TPA: terminase family protein [Vibrio vulnificus]|uniref:terminase large subunit domain-containing protein n=1 Tax=Vibrio vulnificus TaxID=672 RepID=UPI0028936231|nr:terminase family protein [Vibrio vulnificus]WNJ72079.1 terminase family protein [Vibrio vulnificus]